MPFFRRSLSEDEREAALNYYTEFLKVLAFHEQEADRYNEAGLSFQSGAQSLSDIQLLMKAAERLTCASEEAFKRHEALSNVPEVASAHFSSWQDVLEWTIKWSNANHEALRLMSLGQDRAAANAKSYQALMMERQESAERKSSELLKRLQLNQAEASRLLAQAALALEDWDPAESQDARTNRLFTETFALYLQLLPSFIEEEHERADHFAWLVGGSAAANIAVKECQSVKDAWGEGDEQKALDLTRVFTLAMVSKWYRNLHERVDHAESECEQARRVAFGNVLLVFGQESQATIMDALLWDAQFNYDNDFQNSPEYKGRVGAPGRSGSLLCAMAEKACSGSTMEWGNIQWPWRGTHEALEGQGVPLPPFFDTVAVALALGTGGISMYQTAQEIEEGTLPVP